MVKTPVISLTLCLTGFWDTGRTSMVATVVRQDYDSTQAVGHGLSNREELHTTRKEIFLSEAAEEEITLTVTKALSEYLAALALP